MTTTSQHRSQKLVAFIARFEEATAAHDAVDAARDRAVALDLALEHDAAEHGIAFDEIVTAWQANWSQGQHTA